MTFEWPQNLALYYQKRFFEGRYVLVTAWQEIDKSVLVELLDTIRNRTLNMALEIKEKLGTAADNLQNISPTEVEKVRQTVINNIYGGTNYFASGQSGLTATTHTVLSVGNRRDLDAILTKAGINQEDLERLSEAIEADGNQKPGSRISAWIKTTAPKVIAGGVKIGVQMGQELLTQWIRQYYGLK